MNKTFVVIVVGAGIILIFLLSRLFNIQDEFDLTLTEPEKEQDASAFSHWVSYNPDSHSFIVEFPREPQHVSESAQDLMKKHLKHYEIYAAEGLDGNAYMIEEVTFPKGPDPQRDAFFLEKTLSEIVTSSDVSTLENKEKVTFQGHEAIQFRIDAGEKVIQGLMFLSKETLYVLTLVSMQENKDANQEFKHFVNSFKLKKIDSGSSPKNSNQ